MKVHFTNNAKQFGNVARCYFICIVISSCNNGLESETEEIIRTEFKNNYRFVVENELTLHNNLDKLEKLEDTNPDAFRSIAFSWQNAAIETCRSANSPDIQSKRKSSYEMLIQKESSILPSHYKTDELVRLCVNKFYAANWEKINEMIIFNRKLNY